VTVDPLLMRGDTAFDLGRIPWTRIDELSDASEITQHFPSAVDAAEMDDDHGRDWIPPHRRLLALGLTAGLTKILNVVDGY
jgi:streptomycin 6-kinase